MNEVKICFTGGKDNSLTLQLTETEVLTLKEWVIDETPTLSIYIEADKGEITLFRSHITCIIYR